MDASKVERKALSQQAKACHARPSGATLTLEPVGRQLPLIR